MNAQEAENEVEKLFQTVDFDKSGFIDYNEFIAASMDKKTMFTKAKL